MKKRRAKTRQADALSFLEFAIQSNTNECLDWPYGRAGRDYGQTTHGGRREYVHRVVCKVVHGDEPFAGAVAEHLCGNSLCANPRHIRWATQSENLIRRRSHGTANWGERNGGNKISEKSAREILTSSEPSSVLATKYGITPRMVRFIRQRKKWAHL